MDSDELKGDSEDLQAVRHSLEKCLAFLTAKTPSEALQALWHVSQLGKLMRSDIIEKIISLAVDYEDFRVRYEICHLVNILGLRDMIELLDKLRNDPNPDVQEAYHQVATSSPQSTPETKIVSSSSALWDQLPQLYPMLADLLPGIIETKEKRDWTQEIVQDVFGEWLHSHPAPDEKRFAVGLRTLSARDIVREVKNGSEFGMRLLKMVMKILIRRGLQSDRQQQ